MFGNDVVVSIRSLFRILVCILLVINCAIILLTNIRTLSSYESYLAVKVYGVFPRI